MWKWMKAKPPKVGSVWTWHEDVKNPFRDFYVTVERVRNGYVLFKYPYGSLSSMSVRAFRFSYREVKQ